MRRFAITLMLFGAFLSLSLPVWASELLSAHIDKEECTVGEYLRVKVECNVDNVGAFLADTEFDPENLRYVRLENDSGDYVSSAEGDKLVRTVYTVDDNGKGPLFTLVFKVLPGAETAEVSVKLYDIVDSNAQKLSEDKTIKLSSELVVPSGDALLLDLIPSTGELNEDFSPYTYEYTMSVPYEVETMSFEAAVSESAKCSINRKNLGSGGSVTDFILTVSSEDGKTKNTYTVKVTRGEYVRPAGEGSSDSPDKAGDSSGETDSPQYETLMPELSPDDALPGTSAQVPVSGEDTVVVRNESPINSGNSMVWFLAGAAACLVCVFAGVLIAKLFSGTGKHGKH